MASDPGFVSVVVAVIAFTVAAVGLAVKAIQCDELSYQLSRKTSECDLLKLERNQLERQLAKCQEKISEAKAWLEADEEESDGE